MKRSTFSPSPALGTRALFGVLSIAALPLFLALGCQGSLEGDFPAQSGSGSGGSTSGSGGSGSGGTGSGGTGSGGSGTGSGGSSGAACDVPTKVFAVYACSNSGCHGAGDTPPNLAASNVGSMLKSMNSASACSGMKYIDPSNPKNSVIYKIVAGPDCNDRMPLGNPLTGTDLTDALTCLEDWISKQ